RDFRLAEGTSKDDAKLHPVFWHERNYTLVELGPNHWRATVERVEDEWVAFHIRTIFRSSSGNRMFFTTQTNIIPDTLPVPPCYDEDSCYGVLV
ncbi:hypothetical protein LSH36_192g01016, partial [Paralvinella palmiformis]